MNKKILLSTTIASAMFVTGMAVSAATPTEVMKVPHISQYTFQAGTTEGKDTISISLAKEGTTLTKEDVAKLVDERYGTKGFVKEIVTKSGYETVGTGSKIVLQNGKTLTVVLYGDVDGTGVINHFDALQALSFSAGADANLDIFQQKAAKVSLLSEGVSHLDALRILSYNADPEFKETVVQNDKEGELVATDNFDSVIEGTLKIGKVNINNDGSITNKNINVVVNGSEVTIYGNIAELNKTENLKVNIPVGAQYDEVKDIDTVFDITGRTGKNLTYNVPKKEDKEGKSITITTADKSQSLTITVKLVNVEAPVVTKVTKATGDENLNANMARVEAPAEDAEKGYLNGTTIKVGANVTLMKNYERTVNDKKVSGKWIALELATEVDEELVASEDYVQVEKVNGKTIVWVDALTVADKDDKTITLRNVNAPEVVATKSQYTLDLDSTSKFGLTNVADITANYKTDDSDTNDATVESVTGNSDKNYTVSMAINTMKAYARGENLTENSPKYKWYSVEIPLVGITADDVTVDSTKYDADVTEDKTKITVWFKAEDGDQVITLRHTIEDNKQEQEIITIGLKLVDTTEVKFTARKAENTADATYTANMKAVDVTNVAGVAVNAWNNAMTEYVPEIVKTTEAKKPVGERNNSKLWYGLIVETEVERELLVTDYAYVVTDKAELAKYGVTSNTEVLVWVDANTASTPIKLYNKNQLEEGKTIETTEKAANLTITTELKTDFKFTGSKTISVTDENLVKVIGTANKKFYKNNMNYVGVTADTTKTVYTVKATGNALTAYEKDGVKGAWVPVIIGSVLDNTNALESKAGFDEENLATFGGAEGKDLLVWVDASKVGETEYKLVKAGQSEAIKKETVTLKIKVENTGVMELKSAKLATTDVTKVPGFTNPEYRNNYIVNESNVSNVVVDKANRKITLDVNTDKLLVTRKEEETELKEFALIIDTGIAREKLAFVNTKGDNTLPNKALWYVPTDADIDCSDDWEAKANEIMTWITVDTSKKGTETAYIQFIDGTEGSQDGLFFTVIINKK